MRYQNVIVFDAVAAAPNANSRQYDESAQFAASVQVVITGANVAGTVKLQASNDNPNSMGDQPDRVTITNWTDIPGAAVTVTTAGSYLVPVMDLSYGWLRVVYTSTATGVQTITTVADVAKSLAGKYLLVTAPSGNKYAFWFKVSGTGTAPVVSGFTATEVDITTGDTAGAVATALAAVMTGVAAGDDFSAAGVGAVVTSTNVHAGGYAPATAGTSGFTFAVVTPLGTVSARLVTKGF